MVVRKCTTGDADKSGVLNGAQLSAVKSDDACWSESTHWPNGFTPPGRGDRGQGACVQPRPLTGMLIAGRQVVVWFLSARQRLRLFHLRGCGEELAVKADAVEV